MRDPHDDAAVGQGGLNGALAPFAADHLDGHRRCQPSCSTRLIAKPQGTKDGVLTDRVHDPVPTRTRPLNLGRLGWLVAAGVLAMISAACGDDAEEAGTIQITFDGESCRYDGPESTVAGPVVITLNNPTDHQYLHLHLFTFIGDKGWQDLVELMGGDKAERPPPPWITNVVPTEVGGDPSESVYQERFFREWEYSLDPRQYGIVCAAHEGLRGIWLAAPLEVRPEP